MPHVVLTGNLRQLTDGETELDLDARDVRGVLRALGERFPRMAAHLEEGIAVAIDGEIYQDALFAPVRPDSEVHIMPKIGGG